MRFHDVGEASLSCPSDLDDLAVGDRCLGGVPGEGPRAHADVENGDQSVRSEKLLEFDDRDAVSSHATPSSGASLRCRFASGESDRLGTGDDLFHYLGGPDDAHAVYQLLWGDTPRLGTGATKPHLALVADELSHEIVELRKPVRLDALAAALAPQANRFDRAEDNCILSRRGRDVGGNEGQRCSLRLFTAPGAVEDQLLVHFCLSTVMVRRPSSCASVDVIRCPSSRAREGKSSLAAGSLTTTSNDSPIETLAIWRRNS